MYLDHHAQTNTATDVIGPLLAAVDEVKAVCDEIKASQGQNALQIYEINQQLANFNQPYQN